MVKTRGATKSVIFTSGVRDKGLRISSDDRFGLENIVNLLESGNEDMSFRYFTWRSTSKPELGWAREVVGQLMEAVSSSVQPNGPVKPGPAAKMNVICGKPIPVSACLVSQSSGPTDSRII